MSFLEVLFWIGVVYCAVVVFCLVGFSIITDWFSDTSKKFCSRVFVVSLVISLIWPFALLCIVVLWALGELAE
jgi:hypothetical protein